MKRKIKKQTDGTQFFYLWARKLSLLALLVLVPAIRLFAADDLTADQIKFEDNREYGYITVTIPYYDDHEADEWLDNNGSFMSYMNINGATVMQFHSDQQNNGDQYWVKLMLLSGVCVFANGISLTTATGWSPEIKTYKSDSKCSITFRYYLPESLLDKEFKIDIKLRVEGNNKDDYNIDKSQSFTANKYYNAPSISYVLSSTKAKYYTVSGNISSTTGSDNIYYRYGGGAYNSFTTTSFSYDVSVQDADKDVTTDVKYVINNSCGSVETVRSVTTAIQGYPLPTELKASNATPGKVELAWKMATTGNQTGTFTIQRADNANFTNPVTIASNLSISDRNYIDDIVSLNLNETYHYRIRRSSDPDGWEWNAADTTSLKIVSIHKSIATAAVIMDENNLATITWTFNDNNAIWSEKSTVIITRINTTMGGSKEDIEVPADSLVLNRYTEQLSLLCNTFRYEVQVKPGSNKYEKTTAITTASVTPIQMGAMGTLKVSKGYFSDRVELEWTTDGGAFTEFLIQRREYGTSNAFLQVERVAASTVSSLYQYVDIRLAAGIIYEYQVIGVTICDGKIKISDSLEGFGFRTPTGDIYGRVTFENGQAVEGVEVSVETEVAIESKSLAFTAGAVATVNDTSFLKNNTDSVTLQAWIAPAATAGLQKVISKDGMYELGISDNLFYFKAGGETLATDTFSVTAAQVAGEFIHLTGVYDSRRLLIYINGKLIAETDSSPVITGNDNPITFGGGDFEGILDEVRIWSIPLTAADIKRDYTRYLTGEEKNLIAYHTFNYATDSAFYDISYQSTEYNGNHGKLSAGVSLSSHCPTNSQLGNKGVTGADGSYAVRAIPYKGNSTAYQIIPRMGAGMGIHRFEPEREVRSISPTSQNHTVNFIDTLRSAR
ncbi:hypothetical protein FACS1894177_04800 [Bacteroidia bacterium]|nr:hypothetical protein FACS1894177_04800 [Bacteroidia bacterium]